jgi:hypothetical protein
MKQVEINKTIHLSEHLASPSEAALGHLSELNGSHLSPHFTLGELTKTSTGMMNIPSRVSIENMKRVCGWLEALRCRYNQRYVISRKEEGGKRKENTSAESSALRVTSSPPEFLAEPSGKAERGGVRGGLNERQVSPSSDHPEVTAAPSSDHPEVTAAPSSDHPAHPGTPPNLGGEKDTEEPIIISSGYRSPDVNRKVGGSATSNHLTGCAVDIRVAGIEQALRYAVILMDYADETRQDYDELLIERNRSGRYWVHFAVRPPKSQNRRKTAMLSV